MREIWKTIQGYEAYEVSSLGNVRRSVSANYPAGRKLREQKCKAGYCRVTLSKDGAAKKFLVHRLVAFAFHGDPSATNFHASHLNGNPSDNRADNLAWKAPSDNNLDKRQHGTIQRGEKTGKNVLTEADVLKIRELRSRKFGTMNWGATLISRELGLPINAVDKVVKGRTWTHVGNEVTP